jgi:hypothetical protein
LSLLGLSCSTARVLTTEEQTAYDLINSIGNDLYYKTLTNNLHKYDDDKISEYIYPKGVSALWRLSSHPFAPLNLDSIFSKQEIEHLTKKTINLKRIKLDRDFILNSISIYRTKGYGSKINFPIISRDGDYGVVFFQDYMEESIKIYKREVDGWVEFCNAPLSISEPIISEVTNKPQKKKFKTGNLKE